MPEDLERIWESARRHLRRTVPPRSYRLWVEPLEPAALEDGALLLRTPGHIRAWVRDRYLRPLREAAAMASDAIDDVQLVDERWAPGVPGDHEHGRAGLQRDALNPKYGFDQFVIGAGNRLAHGAALAVAELPGQAYNPLFVHGPPGVGKTHLLQAIGNYVRLYGLELSVQYVTVEGFTSEFVQALQARDTRAFRERFREVDVLLVDDVQFLADKAATEEEFFHTFNSLFESGHQVVLSSDRAPNGEPRLAARLRERFGSGLVVDLEPPAFEVRMAILRKRASHDAISEIGDDTLAEIASHVTSSIRALEGALIHVVAYASLHGRSPSPELAGRVLSRLRPSGGEHGSRQSVEEIQDVTARSFGLTREALLVRDRRPRISEARQVAMFLARELTGEALPAIGRQFGDRNHTTVLHAHRKVSRAIERDRSVQSRIQALRSQLAGVDGDRTR